MPKYCLVASLLSFSSCVSATLTASEKTSILKKHNDLRAAITTPCSATDMETLVWDETLATESQAYADACVGDHPADAGKKFGENLWMLTSGSTYSSDDLVGAVQEWYNEIKDVEWIKNAAGDYAEAKSKAGTAGCESPDTPNGNCFIGHFTQVVWAKSNKVGCGVKKCSPMTVSGQSYANGAVLVCRYTPTGNSAASKAANHLLMPYIPGTKCAACSGSCSTTGLCDTGSTPTRCADKNPPYKLNGVSHQTCTAYVGAVSAMLGKTGLHACTNAGVESMITGFCDLTCSKCSVPNGVGTCSGTTASTSTGTGSTGSASNGTTGTTGSSNGTASTSGSGSGSGSGNAASTGGSSGASAGDTKGTTSEANMLYMMTPAALFVSILVQQLG
jgi:hypothetical protein